MEFPACDVVDICISTNNYNFVDALIAKTGQLSITQNQLENAGQSVINSLSIDKLFPYLKAHDHTHKLNLIQDIVGQYLKFKKFILLKNYNNENKQHGRKKLMHQAKYIYE